MERFPLHPTPGLAFGKTCPRQRGIIPQCGYAHFSSAVVGCNKSS